MHLRHFFAILFCLTILGETTIAAQSPAWPAPEAAMKPWAYWWWMGSAVTPEGIEKQMTQLAEAGMGGLHIIPIYGAEGAESRYVSFLSPEWMELLYKATDTAASLGMGIDMTLGTGWPYGGPWVHETEAARKAFTQIWEVAAGEELTTLLICLKQPEAPPAVVRAYYPNGKIVDLTDKVQAGALAWKNTGTACTVVALFEGWTRQEVKRAAPGGEGLVLDHFSRPKLGAYLARFDQAFADYTGTMPRCFYLDSYEVYGANWTDGLWDAFARNRGYDLRDHLQQLCGKGDSDTVGRVRSDYNETVGELLLREFTEPWAGWVHDHDRQCRAESHGSPGNLLDLYAAADIPETEGFGPEGAELLMTKFASSAAHQAGKNWVSSESCTWLSEHFQTSLATVKGAMDQLFLGGVNHVFYHGIPYTPPDAPWPGWLFYASTDFGTTNTFYRDIPALNGYITRCQSFLQAGRPDAEALLYWPVQDVWHVTDGDEIPLKCLSVHNTKEWLHKALRPFHRVAQTLWDGGIDFDYISDRQIAALSKASFIVVPGCTHMPPETLEHLARLAEGGARIFAPDGLPQEIPGLSNLSDRKARLGAAATGLAACPGYSANGELITGLDSAGARREAMADQGFRFVRRHLDDGYAYFVVNTAASDFDGWLPLSAPAGSVAILDPLSGTTGYGACRKEEKGCAVRVRLTADATLILRTFDREQSGGPYPWVTPGGDSLTLAGEWRVRFLDGGPALPAAQTSESGPVLWSALKTPESDAFSGTAAYETTFRMEAPAAGIVTWRLHLGNLHESAKVYLNDQFAGAVWTKETSIDVGKWILPGENRLRIEVTNLMANRIADMDRRGEKWRFFYFVNIDYKPFDAASWPVLPSGLGGPVTLTPMKAAE